MNEREEAALPHNLFLSNITSSPRSTDGIKRGK
jgi:hypothetical protein